MQKNRVLNAYTILDTIKTLERVGCRSKLKAETEFMRPPLKGLWHKHYLPNNIQSFARNLINSIKVEGLPSLDELAHEAEVTNEASFTNDLGADSLDTVELIMEFDTFPSFQVYEILLKNHSCLYRNL